jgi:smad nuclear-interacting protein 1
MTDTNTNTILWLAAVGVFSSTIVDSTLSLFLPYLPYILSFALLSSEKKESDKRMSSISDEEAMKALMSSATARERERKEESKGNQRQEQSGDRDGQQRKRGGDRDSQYGHSKRTRSDDHKSNNNNDASYYGPAQGERNQDESTAKEDEEEKPPPAHKPNFGLSGALAKDEGGGGTAYKGVVLKFREPPEARAPNTQWRFYLFKGEDLIETLHVSKQSAYLMGRNTDIADIPMAHSSLSSQHAVLQYRALPTKDGSRLSCQPYIMDLESTNGTFLNGVRIDSARYYQLKKGDVLKFGASTREYVLMTENTQSIT